MILRILCEIVWCLMRLLIEIGDSESEILGGWGREK